MVYLVTVASLAMLELQEHLALQVSVKIYLDLLGCLGHQDLMDNQASQDLRAIKDLRVHLELWEKRESKENKAEVAFTVHQVFLGLGETWESLA